MSLLNIARKFFSKIFNIYLFLFSFFVFNQFSYSWADEIIYSGSFPGRISKLNPSLSLMRVRMNFSNAKFLRENDSVEFWNEGHPQKKCFGAIAGKSAEYFLIKVTDWNNCVQKVGFSVGAYILFQSSDLEKTLAIARDMVKILLQKRLVLENMLSNKKVKLDDQISQVEAINSNYQAMIERIKNEWNNALKNLQDSKSDSERQVNSYQAQLDDLDFQLEKYRVENENFKKDRWSLDENKYQLK